ncbi:MAG: DUF5615 family PIN-like protein [Cyanobacteria bacterium J06621_11]
MKLLLDECIDRRLAREFSEHEVKTVPQMNWAGLKDGQLLQLAAQEFDAFITVDRNLPFEQNLSKLELIVLILQTYSNRLPDLKRLVPEINYGLTIAQKGKAMLIKKDSG